MRTPRRTGKHRGWPGEVEALSKQVAGQKAALQELSSRADACEEALAGKKRESADRDRELAELRKKTGT